MSMFTDSKYRVARKQFHCRHLSKRPNVPPGDDVNPPSHGPVEDHQLCGKDINPGDKYLSWAPGYRSRTPICLEHSRQVGMYGPVYDCADVRTELENIQDPP